MQTLCHSPREENADSPNPDVVFENVISIQFDAVSSVLDARWRTRGDRGAEMRLLPRSRALLSLAVALILAASAPGTSAASVAATAATADFFRNSTHTNNWAILVDTSRYWFNYRHVANTLSFYRTVKRLGIPDSRIILMLADDFACDARNAFPGEIYGSRSRAVNLYGDDIEVDYRGYEVTPENLLRVLTNRHPKGTPRSKRALTDKRSNVLLYLTGHGGDEFLKFQDQREILSKDVADALHQMKRKNRYDELLFIAETCQASTMANQFYSPDVLSIGSSGKGENSLSHHNDDAIGLSVIDRFTFYTLEFMERVRGGAAPEDAATARDTVNDWFRSLTKAKVRSTAAPDVRNYARDLKSVRVTDFFGSAAEAFPRAEGYGGAFSSRSENEKKEKEKDEDASTSSRLVAETYAEASESYRPLEDVLFASDPLVERTRNGNAVSTFGIPAGRIAAYVACVAFAPALAAASRAMQKHF
jgi:phosphatidylinositol glycan class K